MHLRLPWQYFLSIRRYPASAFTTEYPPASTSVGTPTHAEHTFFQSEICTSLPPEYGFSTRLTQTGHIIKCSTFRPSFYHLAISTSQKQKTTYCLLLSKNDDHQFSSLIDTILATPATITSPLCVAVHLVNTCVRATQGRLVDVDGALNEIDEVTGQHEWANRPSGDPMAMDFMKVGRRLNFNSRTLGIEKMRVQTLLGTIQELKRVDTGECKDIEQLLRYHENACNMQLHSIEFQDRRVQSQLAVVYQFMSQKDSKTNIELAASSASIAKETKRDGTAMKTIAILTMFFLPGTFLAVSDSCSALAGN
jgi:hypothetical protein